MQYFSNSSFKVVLKMSLYTLSGNNNKKNKRSLIKRFVKVISPFDFNKTWDDVTKPHSNSKASIQANSFKIKYLSVSIKQPQKPGKR